MKVPKCSYCPELCEGQAFHISEQAGERRMRHICEKCLIFLFDAILGQKTNVGYNVTFLSSCPSVMRKPIREGKTFKLAR